MYVQFIKTDIVRFLQTTVPLLSCVLQQKVWKELSLNIKDNDIITPLQSSVIPGDSSTNQLTFYMTPSVKHLMQEKKFEEYSVILAKRSIAYGTQVYCVNSRRLVLLEIFLDGLIHTVTIESNV